MTASIRMQQNGNGEYSVSYKMSFFGIRFYIEDRNTHFSSDSRRHTIQSHSRAKGAVAYARVSIAYRQRNDAWNKKDRAWKTVWKEP